MCMPLIPHPDSSGPVSPQVNQETAGGNNCSTLKGTPGGQDSKKKPRHDLAALLDLIGYTLRETQAAAFAKVWGTGECPEILDALVDFIHDMLSELGPDNYFEFVGLMETDDEGVHRPVAEERAKHLSRDQLITEVIVAKNNVRGYPSGHTPRSIDDLYERFMQIMEDTPAAASRRSALLGLTNDDEIAKLRQETQSSSNAKRADAGPSEYCLICGISESELAEQERQRHREVRTAKRDRSEPCPNCGYAQDPNTGQWVRHEVTGEEMKRDEEREARDERQGPGDEERGARDEGHAGASERDDKQKSEIPNQKSETPRRPGRPKVLDEPKKAKIVAYFEMGLSQRQAAGMVGVDPQTIANERKRDADFDDECLYANRRGAYRPLMKVIQASNRSWRAAAWLVRNHRPCPEIRREEAEERDREFADGFGRLNKLVVSA